MTTFVLESTWAEDWDGEVAGESWTDEDAENALTWLTNIGSGAASGAATGAVAGPWGALIGGLVGGGLGAAQTALQQSQQNQQPAQRPPAPAARPAPTPAPAPRPAPAPAPTPPRAAPVRTIAVPRPAPTRPAPTAPAPASGGVSTSDVAHLVTTLAPLLVALGQQLATDPAPAAAPAPEAWEGADVDPWPEGEAVDDGTSALSSYPVEAYDDPAGEAASESDSETECWAAEGEWQQVMA